MKKYFLFLLVLFCSTQISIAQQKTISGKVIDTFNNESLEYATVTVLRASDSVLLGFARTSNTGDFSLRVADEKKYLLLITCPGFADYTDIVSSGSTPNLSLGKLVLYTREKLLSEFVIHQKRGSIIIKGDTTEYIADSFKLDANANVESLLKKLPGLQVDKNGQVTAQGEKVQKILVDGEEFFSDDPAVVNKNLQAKTVDKVQVFDKKSENAEFTGIDDGERIKTINLQLKDKYKKGYFGKVSLGGGNDGFFENQGMFNYFRGKQKFSVYGIMANTGKVGLSYQDADKFGGGNDNRFYDEENGYSFTTSDEDGNWGGQYNGQGLPKAWTAGAHYSNKWNEDKHHLSSNYRFNRQNIETVNNVLTQYSLPDSVYYNDQRSNSFTSSDRHGLTGLYEWKVDSLSTIKLTANASKRYRKSNTDVNAESHGSSTDDIINNSFRRNLSDEESDNVNTAAIWKKKFKKSGRNLMLELTLNQKNSATDAYLLATNSFYTEGIKDSITSVDQKKRNESQTSSIATNLTYTEPISKKGFLELTYRFNNQNNFSRQLSYNKNALNQYSDLDTLYSTDYDFDVNTHRGGASLRWVYEKVNFSFGAAVANTLFTQKDNLFNTTKDRTFNNFFPSAAFTYKFTKQSNLRINYRGNTQQPTIEQLQPVRQNTDPLNISIGNPNLTQEFDNQISFNYNSYKVLQGTYYYAGGSARMVSNDISRSETVGAAGIRTYQYINVDGNYNANLYFGAGYRIPKYDLNLGFNAGVNQNRNNNIVNNQKNINDNNSYSLGLRVGYEKEKKVDISYDPNVAYNINTSSLNKQTTAFWSTSQNLNVLVYLPKKFQISTDLSWSIRQRTATFDRNNNVFQVNAFVSKKLTKKDELEIRASVFDIFNQNLGFSQTGFGNAVTQQSYNTIRRYGMLSLVWNFTYSPKAETKTDEIQMIEITK
jgi:hypothetical protein